ncbi:MAG: HNH endonuclease, partial [Pseudomonadales bacterium]|nr:HNH endonuclease [Pseudomonadales bacterium]
CGLSLSVEKTRITHVRDGFNFLGFRLELDTGRDGRKVPKIKIDSKAKQALRQRLAEAMRRRPHQESIALRLQRGSAVVRGWSEYYRIAHNLPAIAGTLDHWALWIGLKAICRKLDIPTGKAMKRFYRNGRLLVDESCQLATFSGIKVKLDYRSPKPYKPETVENETDEQMEADFARYNERNRFGNMDVKFKTLQRDNYRCQKCDVAVTHLTSQADHIIPVKRFANFTVASADGNLQTLCLDCHREKHSAK